KIQNLFRHAMVWVQCSPRFTVIMAATVSKLHSSNQTGESLHMKSFAYAAQSKTSSLTPFHFDRREPGPNDVVVAIDYCGICHSDIHQVRDEWGAELFPMVPGHEIIGHVKAVGSAVT